MVEGETGNMCETSLIIENNCQIFHDLKLSQLCLDLYLSIVHAPGKFNHFLILFFNILILILILTTLHPSRLSLNKLNSVESK